MIKQTFLNHMPHQKPNRRRTKKKYLKYIPKESKKKRRDILVPIQERKKYKGDLWYYQKGTMPEKESLQTKKTSKSATF